MNVPYSSLVLLVALIGNFQHINAATSTVALNRTTLASMITNYATSWSFNLTSKSIVSIDASTFSNLKSVRYIYLNKNYLTYLPSNTFNGLNTYLYFILQKYH